MPSRNPSFEEFNKLFLSLVVFLKIMPSFREEKKRKSFERKDNPRMSSSRIRVSVEKPTRETPLGTFKAATHLARTVPA